MTYIQKKLERNADYFLVAFRLIIGVLFLLHAVMKVQMVMSGKLDIMSMMGAAMIIESIVGLLLILGLVVRYAAILGAVEMLVAYFTMHLPKGLNPLANGGELAILFFSAFLVLIAYGAKKWSIDSMMN